MSIQTFIKLSDRVTTNRKLRRVGTCARWLWVASITTCGRDLSDGLFPEQDATSWAAVGDDIPAAVAELVSEGLWHRLDHTCPKCPQPESDDELYVHDYLEYQRSRADAEALSVKRAAAGRRGGLAKQSAKQVCSQLPSKRLAETETETENSSSSRKRDGVTDDHPDWQAFWSTYPRKVGKGAARKAWSKAVAAAGDPTVVIAGATAYAAAVKESDPQFIAHPATWLNGERWSDELPQAQLVDDGPRSGVFTTPDAPPPHIADDPALYAKWIAEQRAKRQGGAA